MFENAFKKLLLLKLLNRDMRTLIRTLKFTCKIDKVLVNFRELLVRHFVKPEP